MELEFFNGRNIRRIRRRPGPLEDVKTTDELLAATRDFLATFTPQHLARLPAEYRPGRIKGEDDIEYWTGRLAQMHRKARGYVDGALYDDLLAFFIQACIKLSELRRQRACRPRLQRRHVPLCGKPLSQPAQGRIRPTAFWSLAS